MPLLFIFGIVLLVFANIIGVGTFLYNWGANDMAVGLAAWTAFKIWIGVGFVGFISLVSGAMAGK